MCLGTSVYMPLRTERGCGVMASYKHIASPEQRPGVTDRLFVQSRLSRLCTKSTAMKKISPAKAQSATAFLKGFLCAFAETYFSLPSLRVLFVQNLLSRNILVTDEDS
jgi:hypothetical protein